MSELRRHNEEMKQSNEEFRRSNEEFERSIEELKNKNKRLAELESKIDGSFYKYGIYSTPATKPEQP